jgi:radical SAM protein with 4Fe4S-binding SPASM domain
VHPAPPPGLKNVARIPKYAIWEITKACNMKCIHCEGSAGKREGDELTTAEALALCDELIAEGCEQCNISGGEPLLRRDWPLLCRRLADGGVRVTLVTNGSLLDAASASKAVEAGVACVALSVDGLRATHDRIRPFRGSPRSSFDALLATLQRVQATQMPVAIITHVNRWNLVELDAMHAMFRDLAVEHWQIQLGVPLGRQREIGVPYMIGPEQLPSLARTLAGWMKPDQRPKLLITDTIGYYTEQEPYLRVTESGEPTFWAGCYAGILAVGIESNGDITGCSSLPREFVAGNLRHRPFREIWADEEGFAYNTRWQEAWLTGYCAHCSYRRLCRAGCTSLAYAVTGTIHENPFCLHRVQCTGTGCP